MSRLSAPEYDKAKMLARKVSDFHAMRVPPLSRARAALSLLCHVVAVVAVQRFGMFSRWIRDKEVCPLCEGRKELPFGDAHIVVTGDCLLCHATGEVTWREIESYKYGQAALRYRRAAGLSLAQWFYTCGLIPQAIEQHEQGLVPIERFNPILLHRAKVQLQRENPFSHNLEG